jgi:hypothetical protein
MTVHSRAALRTDARGKRYPPLQVSIALQMVLSLEDVAYTTK